MPDHVHILFLLNPVKSVAEIVKNLKGSSSHWVNQNHLTRPKFSWQTGYAAFAVSESQMQKAYEYIANQKEHHQHQDFESEEKHLLELHGLKEE
jgi:REP element-mobilizing transposase RayT